jgi:hypothetical protein
VYPAIGIPEESKEPEEHEEPVEREESESSMKEMMNDTLFKSIYNLF